MSPASPDRFSRLLSEAIQLIAYRQHKNRQAVQDEIGYAIGRNGGTAIAYWIYRKRIPARLSDIETLAQVISQRGGWEDISTLIAFLESAGHANSVPLARKLLRGFESRIENSPNEEGASLPFPFVMGPPILLPRQFFGREWELRRIFNVIQGPVLQNIAIVGKPRSGKTSLLHYIKNISRAFPAQLRPDQAHEWLSNSSRYQWAFIDFQDPRMCTQAGFFQSVLTQLQIPSPGVCSLNNFMDLVSQQLYNPTVILMDEFQVALRSQALDDSFWWGLRSLGTNLTEGRLGYILASQIMREDLNFETNCPSPFLNIFGHLIELGPLSRESALELINSSPDPFDPADVEWILETSQRWPSLVQILAMACWTSMKSGGRIWLDWKKEGLKAIDRFHYLLQSSS